VVVLCDIDSAHGAISFDFSPRTKVLFTKIVVTFPFDCTWKQTLVSLSGSGLIFQLDFFSDFAPPFLNLPNLLLKEVLMAQKLKRKLSAILGADVKGYSRLMGEDEEWTVRTLDTFKGVMNNIIPQHRGRVVDSTGDNLLAEFASIVDAVQAAVEIQQVLRAKNSLLPENRRMQFRIGINLGDVIEEGERIFGDGVNIAARLEGLAEAGGICISGSAFEQIENKLPLHYDYLGEHEVKNITRPVRIYRALIDNGVVKEMGARSKADP
jgi:class 3 adenylate cyclase